MSKRKEVYVTEPTEILTALDVPIVFDKMLGPAVCWPIRVTAVWPEDKEPSKVHWKIEVLEQTGDDYNWKEYTRINPEEGIEDE
jgi:hypothetical protein